jgi:hypothetical protein
MEQHLFADGQSSNVEVQLITKKYVEKGSSVTLYCRHNVDLDSLYKVHLHVIIAPQSISFVRLSYLPLFIYLFFVLLQITSVGVVQ